MGTRLAQMSPAKHACQGTLDPNAQGYARVKTGIATTEWQGMAFAQSASPVFLDRHVLVCAVACWVFATTERLGALVHVNPAETHGSQVSFAIHARKGGGVHYVNICVVVCTANVVRGC